MMFFMKRNKILFFLPAAAIWLAALIFAGFCDLDISLSFADPMSVFGRFLEIVGEIPAILFASFNCSLIAVCLLRRGTKGRDVILAALSIIGMVGTAYYTTNATFGYIKGWRDDLGLSFITGGMKFFLVFFITAILSALFLFLAFRLSRERLEEFLPAAAHCVLAAIVTLFVIWCFKLLWGRVRFRQLEALSQFTPFYIPNGYTGYFSFPSGHTANATVILTVTYYFRFMSERMKKLKPLLCTLLGLWIVVVALSRVLVGAHYLSDVLCGLAITALIVYLCRPRASLSEKGKQNVHR